MALAAFIIQSKQNAALKLRLTDLSFVPVRVDLNAASRCSLKWDVCHPVLNLNEFDSLLLQLNVSKNMRFLPDR